MKDILQEMKEIVGERISDSPGERCCYASDASQIVGLPDFIARPESTSQVSRILRLCSEQLIPVTARGAGTGLAGGCSPVRGGIVLDMSGMNRILEIDIENQQVIVEPGVVAEKLNLALKPYGFFSARSGKPGHVHHRRNDFLQQQRHALSQIWDCEKLRP